MSTATRFPIALCRARIRPRVPISPAATSHNAYAKYSEEGADYVENMQRLLRKFETAKALVPQAGAARCQDADQELVRLYFGSTSPALAEALAALEKQGIHLNTMRIRAFPFADELVDFINAHDQVFLIEQNRDAQMRTLISMNAASIRRASTPSCTMMERRSLRVSSSPRYHERLAALGRGVMQKTAS